jgi:hypothetical protein
MSKELKKSFSFIKLSILSLCAFVLSSCEDIVLNNDNNESGGESTSCSSSDHCKTFVTSAVYNGNLGGTAGADLKCQSDANTPSSGTYKALILSSTRSVTPSQADWVLKASKEYRRLDGTVVGTTNTNSFFTSLTNGFNTSRDYAWFGGDGSTWQSSGDTCSNWTSTSSGSGGSFITNYAGTNGWSYGASESCNSDHELICIQQ